jgi:ribosomal protein L12E/L44/L45/RPP1/RPP2
MLAYANRSRHVRIQLEVPRAKMGLLIGAQGKNIRELLQEAKAQRAHLYIPPLLSDTHSPENGNSTTETSRCEKKKE